MKLSKKFIAVPAIASAAGIGLTACGSGTELTLGSATASPSPTATHSAAPTVAAPTTPAPTAAAPTTQAPAAPAPAAPAPAAPEPAYFTNATAVVTQFYQDINDGDYSGAWALGGDNIGGTDYSAWVAGYNTTLRVSLGTFSAFGSDQVQASLSALQSDGTVRTYEGTYTVSNGVIVAANIVQTG